MITKNSKFIYYIKSTLACIAPTILLQAKLKRILGAETSEYISNRVDYYNKLSTNTPISASAKIKDFHYIKPSTYYYDSKRLLRYFPEQLSFKYLFGDITHIPKEPSILKSRPISGDNRNSVLLNLNKIRHFLFVNDKLPFQQKKSQIVWRGSVWANQKQRQVFLRAHGGKKYCNAGHINDWDENQLKVEKLNIKQQLKYKFILSIEGNDVATNLKWIMSSNSLCFMPKPRYETWFMEGRLKPNFHYVELKDDFSDLKEKVEYYTKNTFEAEQIIRNANAYVKQFKNKKQERLISLLVLDKYFYLTNGH